MTGRGPGSSDAALPTVDPADRAHDVRDPETGFLRPTRRLPKGMGKPRRYHPSYMLPLVSERTLMIHGERFVVGRVVGLVSFESQFEEQAAREKRLEEMGLEPPRVENVGLATREAMAKRESGR